MADWILAFCTFAGAGVYLRAASQIPRLLVGDEVGPRLFPELIGAGLLLGATLLAWETWRKQSVTAYAGAIAVPRSGRSPVPALAGLAAWTALYYAAFEPAGYVLSTLVYATVLLGFFHRARWYWNLLIAAIFTGAAYALFDAALGVVLPSGLLGLWSAGS